MSGGDTTRLVAWAQEMRRVHHRLREALEVTRSTVADGSSAQPVTRDLLLFCHGFCTALAGHHKGEDGDLFPAVTTQYPWLAETVRHLRQDHSMIAHLLTALQADVDREAAPDVLERHLEGIAAIMESHFRYEERELLPVLETLDLDAEPGQVFGPI